MLNRRQMLAYSGALGGTLLLSGCGTQKPTIPIRQAGHAAGGHLISHGVHTETPSPAITPFSVRMPVPPVLRPVERLADTDVYRLAIEPREIEILPGLNTPVLTYGGEFIGPTIRAKTGRRVRITYVNKHTAPVNVHLHGGNVAASSDGHPMDLIQPNAERLCEYPNNQQGATLWYHDHSHHTEAEHVYRGLHGMYVIDDDAEAGLGLPSGEFDIPIAIRDAHFDENGALIFGHPGLRDTILANGRPQPYLPVAARKYRFRILNCATERTFRLNLGDTPMVQIASDGGLLPTPASRTELGLSPGERAEVVVDFSRNQIGDHIELHDESGPVLRFTVTRRVADRSRVPRRLRALPAMPPATVTRDVSLRFDLTGDPIGVINDQPYDPNRDDFTVRRGTTEIWRVINADDVALEATHNFHLHLVQFRVLDRDGQPPTADDLGRKDTLPIPPGASARIQVTFDSEFLGRYVYHCHFLEHSSIGMMAQMNIVE